MAFSPHSQMPFTHLSPPEVLHTAGGPCERHQVVALGAGRSCCRKWLCYNGTMVHDCHAIIIARRALKRYNTANVTVNEGPTTY